MLSDILKQGKCFKLVCGAGNEDAVEVEKLVYLYSKAGCSLFDLSANLEVVQAAKRGLERAGILDDRYLCVSVGIEGDPHIDKAEIIQNLCVKCGRCKNICPQNAIFENGRVNYVKNKRCIGCGKCVDICEFKAIKMFSQDVDLAKVLPPIIEEGIDCLEFHALIEDEAAVMRKWKILSHLYPNFLSICVDRSKIGNEKLLNRVKKMIENRTPYTTIIQADGAPMSGGCDDYKTTLQAVAMAEVFQDAKLPVYILLSGGTNSKTMELSRQCGIMPNGVAVGSYARKLVKEYVSRDDFFENTKVVNEALSKAKALVNSVFL